MEIKATEKIADLLFGGLRRQTLDMQRRAGIQIQHFELLLGVIADAQMGTRCQHPTQGRQFGHQGFDERRLARAVGAQQTDTRTRMQIEFDIAQHRVTCVAHHHVVQAEQRIGNAIRFQYAKVKRRIDMGRRHGLHALEFFETTLGLARLGSFGTETPHEGFDLRHALLLTLVEGLLLGKPFGTLHFKSRIIAAIKPHLLVFDMHDVGYHSIKEIAVMGDQQQGAGIALQPVFEPIGGVEVEVIGGFVEQQQIAGTHQGLGKIEPDAPATGELRDRPHTIRLTEAQAV